MSKFSTIEEAVLDIKNGWMVVVCDVESRENEGELIMAASKVKPADINFMVREAGGLICVPISAERAKKFELGLMSQENTSVHGTNFSMSVDYKVGTSTGISSFDRAKTINALANDKTSPSDFARPGHVFPLIANKNGVLSRKGHTEAAIDLCKLAGVGNAGVLCEIINMDGSMARVPDLVKFAAKHKLKLISIEDLVAYRLRTETRISKISSSKLPTEFGDFKISVFRSDDSNEEAVVLEKGSIKDKAVVRVHSSCLTGDVFGSKRCDCGEQLEKSLKFIAENGNGLLVYLFQEGRGIGIADKIKAYALQDQGYDTAEANHMLGYKCDLRDYKMAAQIFKFYDLKEIKLLTNNPTKIDDLRKFGFKVERLSIEVKPNEKNLAYLKTKKVKFKHKLKNV